MSRLSDSKFISFMPAIEIIGGLEPERCIVADFPEITEVFTQYVRDTIFFNL